LNAKGGVLGEQIEIVTADDYCEGEQAVAAAHKLVADGVIGFRPSMFRSRDSRVEDLC
jgi:ABC-type branched-subunit amino acid transport system substrate-binding protein